MSISSDINKILDKMHSREPQEKGVFGEQAVLSICEDFYHKQGGILIHSYAYKTIPELAGNVKKQGEGFYIENTGSLTEIDVLFATIYKLYVIEVKSYKANKIILTNQGISGCAITNKSPVHQNEMHCRHLYPSIFGAMPDGMCYEYIVPIVCFVDETTVVDNRDKVQKEYIKVTILNNLKSFIEQTNIPFNNTMLDLKTLEIKLRSVMISNEKFFPYISK